LHCKSIVEVQQPLHISASVMYSNNYQQNLWDWRYGNSLLWHSKM